MNGLTHTRTFDVVVMSPDYRAYCGYAPCHKKSVEFDNYNYVNREFKVLS